MTSSAINLYFNGGNPTLTGPTMTAGQWYHFAVTRAGTSLKMFINGVQSGSTLTDTGNYTTGANRPAIGVDGNNPTVSYFNGYLTDYRITRGYARYTSNFSVCTGKCLTVSSIWTFCRYTSSSEIALSAALS